MTNFNMKSLLIIGITLSFFYSCKNKQQPINYASIDSLIVGKWKMVQLDSWQMENGGIC